jgi:hypothetical protein
MREDGCGRDFAFWAGALALGVAAFVFLLLPAMSDASRTARLHQRLREENATRQRERDRLLLRTDALENDPDEIRRALRDQGYTPEGEITLILDESEER